MGYNRKKLSLGDVSIYLSSKDLKNYFAESYFLLLEHFKYLTFNINKLSLKENHRKLYVDSLKNAQIQNRENVKKVADTLRNKVELESFSQLKHNKSNNTQITLKDF